MRRLLRWVFVVGPCRLYLAGEASGGSVPWAFMGGLLGVATALGGLGALVALMSGADPRDVFWQWALVGLGAVLAWSVYGLLFLVGLWVRGRSPRSVRGVRPAADEASGAGRSVNDGWRRAGRDSLVPGALVGFFCLLALIGFGGSVVAGYEERQYDGQTAVVTAEVLRYDDGWWGMKDRKLVVRYPAGGQVLTGAVAADELGDDVAVPAVGGALEVEYLVTDPRQVRPAGASEQAAGNVDFGRIFGGVSAGLGVLAAIVWLVERRR